MHKKQPHFHTFCAFCASLRLAVGVLLLWVTWLPEALCATQQRSLPENVHTLNLDGQAVDPFEVSDAKAVVFIFLGLECPISNSYMPEYGRLEREHKEIAFRLIFPNADEGAEAIRKHLKDFKCSLQALRDYRHELAKIAQATITPEAAVFVPGKGLVYHGRIDNRYVALGKARPEATVHDLRDVLRAIAAGTPPAPHSTTAVGCYISGMP